ncbi:hypothetical protein BC834DRAFT_1039235 [Gloeopeniophorella convolvens]|nr:hypothetical protein BC834DRAFT_1039235 [Gloeopeniophorella convolvens]
MFKKPLGDAKTSAPLRSSDRRKLRARIAARFQLAPELAEVLVPDGLQAQKFSTHTGEPGVLYLAPDGTPLWFIAGKDSDELVPTVYTLWKHPALLPVLTTPAAVIPVLIGGADLMIPGVVQAPPAAPAGALVAVAQYVPAHRAPPLAVGHLAVPAADIGARALHGKAVLVLHTWKDHLWAMGAGGEPPEAVPEAEDGEGEPAPAEGSSGPAQGEAEPQPEDVPVDAEEEEQLSPEEVSARLRAALLQALQTTLAALPASAFPMPTTTLYTAHILPARAATRRRTTPVDIKHSAHKSLGAFLRAAEKGGLLRLKDARPDAPVAAVFPAHADVDAHAQHRTVGAEDGRRRRAQDRGAEAAAGAAREMVVTELWKPHLGTLPLFVDLGYDTSALYTLAEVRAAMLAYIEKHDLVNHAEQQYLNVRADTMLTAALYGTQGAKGAVPAPEFARRDEALAALCARMQAWHRVAPGTAAAAPVTKKGALRPVAVTVKIRQGRKACTLVTGFEPYQLAADALADALRVRCASSTSVSSVAGGGQEVMVQGKQVPAVLELLASMGVPKRWIETADLTDKKKK